MPILSEPILVRPIKTEADYDAVLVEVEQMMGNVAPGTPEGDRFDLLVTLVNTYEDAHFPLETTADPISMIEFVMEQQGLTRRDLQPFIGPRQRVGCHGTTASIVVVYDSPPGTGAAYSCRPACPRV